MVEFTGERVIPGQVNDDLWSEHVARYAFARRYAQGKRVLDAGCGTGYGSAELAQSAAEVTGVDIAADAIEYANSELSDCRFAVHRVVLHGSSLPGRVLRSCRRFRSDRTSDRLSRVSR